MYRLDYRSRYFELSTDTQIKRADNFRTEEKQ